MKKTLRKCLALRLRAAVVSVCELGSKKTGLRWSAHQCASYDADCKRLQLRTSI